VCHVAAFSASASSTRFAKTTSVFVNMLLLSSILSMRELTFQILLQFESSYFRCCWTCHLQLYLSSYIDVLISPVGHFDYVFFHNSIAALLCHNEGANSRLDLRSINLPKPVKRFLGSLWIPTHYYHHLPNIGVFYYETFHVPIDNI
jgi:hypothetical protein